MAENTTLEEKNAAQKQIDSDNEHLRMLSISSEITITGSNRGDGKWHSPLNEDDRTAVKEFLVKRMNARIKSNRKIIG